MLEKLGRTEEAIKLYTEGAKLKNTDSIYSLVRIYYLKNDMQNMNYWKNRLLNDTEVINLNSNIEKYLNYLNGNENERKIADLYMKSAQNMIMKIFLKLKRNKRKW